MESQHPSPETSATPDGAEGRRDFLMKAGSVCAGCALVGVPVAAGLRVVTHPVTNGLGGAAGGAEAPFIPVTSLDALPDDGSPQKFTVRADRADAWSRFPDQVIGAVFLRRLPDESGEPRVQAFNVVCPHLGCAIDFRDEKRDYFCPCHNSAFALEDGTQEARSPSARGMDALNVRVESGGQIAVQFQNFVMGIREKRPI